MGQLRRCAVQSKLWSNVVCWGAVSRLNAANFRKLHLQHALCSMQADSGPADHTCDTQSKLWSDVAFWGAVSPLNAANISELQGMLEAGALGFKAFLSPSGTACATLWSVH